MTTARVVEALDEFEHRDPCLGAGAYCYGRNGLPFWIVVGIASVTLFIAGDLGAQQLGFTDLSFAKN
jgi:hypothetical protein